MTDTPDKDWIEPARDWLFREAIAIRHGRDTRLARELQSSFDQGDARGTERERERIKQLIVNECYDFDSIGRLIKLIDAPTPTEGERG